MKKPICLACASLFLLSGCHAPKQAAETVGQNADTAFAWGYTPTHKVAALPPVIVYKTRKDYNNLVPVTLDATGTEIAAYPAPSDLRRGDSYAVPTVLDNGYLLDNRGISVHTAFTSYTYEEYAAMEASPSPEDLKAHIIDKNPFVELWHCGQANQYKDKVAELNRLISVGFPGCKMLVGGNVR